MPATEHTTAINVPSAATLGKRGAPVVPYGYMPNSPPNEASLNGLAGLSFGPAAPQYTRATPQSYGSLPNSAGFPKPFAVKSHAAVSGPGFVDSSPEEDDDDEIQFLGQRPAPWPTEKRRRVLDPAPVLINPVLPPSPPLEKPSNIVLRRIADAGPVTESFDDDGGHYLVNKGDPFGDRYVITRLLGQGTFGKVAEVYDKETLRRYAIKIIRAVPKYRDASKIELRVLSMLSRYDTTNAHRCIQLRECFDFRNHVCLVTDLLDISVYDFLRDNQFAPFPGHQIQHFARQLLTSVAFIHRLGLVHTDLKPENILLHRADYDMASYRRGGRGPARQRRVLRDTSVTLIDFGSAIFDDEYHPTVVSTRHYRAPEIILGTGWSHPCDVWSIGCVLVELCTGQVLFQTRENLEHLHMIERTTSCELPDNVVTRAATTTQGQALVDTNQRCLRRLREPKQQQSVYRQQPLRQLIEKAVPYNKDYMFWDGFLDLLRRMLVTDPGSRISAEEALQHQWLAGV